MNCLKCGREIKGKDVFCPECLRVMEQCPVKPGTPVTLPRRDKIERKPQPRRQVKPEEQLARLKKSVRRLRIIAAVLFVALGIVAAALAVRLIQPDTVTAIGQNYSTADTAITPKGPR